MKILNHISHFLELGKITLQDAIHNPILIEDEPNRYKILFDMVKAVGARRADNVIQEEVNKKSFFIIGPTFDNWFQLLPGELATYLTEANEVSESTKASIKMLCRNFKKFCLFHRFVLRQFESVRFSAIHEKQRKSFQHF